MSPRVRGLEGRLSKSDDRRLLLNGFEKSWLAALPGDSWNREFLELVKSSGLLDWRDGVECDSPDTCSELEGEASLFGLSKEDVSLPFLLFLTPLSEFMTNQSIITH